MNRLFTLLLVVLFCSGTFGMLSNPISAQASSFSVIAGNGFAAAFTADRETGVAYNFGLEYQYPLTTNFNLFTGIGLQHTSFSDGTGEPTPCVFPEGLKVVTFTNSDRYRFNRYEITMSLGLEKEFGKFSLRGSLIPTYLLRDRIDVELLTDFTRPNRPDNRTQSTVKPGDSFRNGGEVITVDYSTRFQLQGGLEVLYAASDRISLGLGYRRGLTTYELETRTNLTVCGGLECIPVEVDNSSIDARSGSGFLMLRFKL